MVWPAVMMAMGGMSQMMGNAQQFFQDDSGVRGRDIKDAMKARLVAARVYGEKTGFHPLAALGMQPQNLPSKRVGDKSAALQNMGQTLMKASKAGMSAVEAAQVENLEARTRFINKQAEQIGKDSPAGQASVKETRGVVESDTKAKYEVPRKLLQAHEGFELGHEAMYKYVTMDDGGIKAFPTQQLQESTSEGFHAWEYAYEQIKKAIVTPSSGLMETMKAREFRNVLRKQKRHLDKSAKKGFEFQLDVWNRRWYEMPKQNRLFKDWRLKRFTGKDELLVPNMKLRKSHKGTFQYKGKPNPHY